MQGNKQDFLEGTFNLEPVVLNWEKFYPPEQLTCSVAQWCPHRLQPIRLLCPWKISRQEYWSRLPFPPPGDLSNPETEPAVLHLLNWQEDSLPVSHQGSSLGWFCIFHQIWEVWAIISSNILSDLPLLPLEHVHPHSVHVGPPDGALQVFQTQLTFPHTFYFCSSIDH